MAPPIEHPPPRFTKQARAGQLVPRLIGSLIDLKPRRHPTGEEVNTGAHQ